MIIVVGEWLFLDNEEDNEEMTYPTQNTYLDNDGLFLFSYIILTGVKGERFPRFCCSDDKTEVELVLAELCKNDTIS